MNLRAVGGGLAGGMLAGALVGAVEAIVVWAGGPDGGALPIGWGMLVYGGLGALGGLGLGVLAALAGLEGFAVAFPAVTFGVGLVVGRFRVIRDVFLEQLPGGPTPLLVQAAAAAACLGLGVWLWSRLRGVEERRAGVTNPLVAALIVATIGGGWWLAAGGTNGVAGARAVGRTGSDGPNVVLLIIDTLRADRLSAYGYARNRTPHIDALADDGLRYTAFAQASWTRPSVATILTGLYPSSHGAVHKVDLLPDRVETLAEIMAADGYATVGFPNNVNVSDSFNFQQGFAEYHYLAPDLFFGATEAAAKLTFYSGLRMVRERFLARRVNVHHYYQPAAVVTDRTLAWLDGVRPNERFFLYAHYMDPHDPYMVHPFDGEGYARVKYPNPPADLASRFSDLYDGEISYLDEHIGRLVAGLRSRGLYESTMVVLTSDHGVEFHEHGGWWHGTTLYDEQIAVPLIVKPVGAVARGQVVPGLAASLDIAPTIVAATGASPSGQMQGQPLPFTAAVALDRTQVFSEEDFEGNVLQTVRTSDWKFMTANAGNPRGLPESELYDVAGDPQEQQNLVATRGPQAEEMRAALGRGFLEARAQEGQGAETEIDAVTKDRLKALGYLE
jgi:arylsulfatase A-like enzyme